MVCARRRECREPDADALVHLVALAELEGFGPVLQLFRRDEALVHEQALEGGEPALVIARALAARLGLRDLGDEPALEFLPAVEAVSAERHGHAEDAALPGLFEDELAVPAWRG